MPYPREKAEQKGQKEQKQYGEIAQQLRADGVTGALLHEAAPITVTCFAKNLATYAEEIPFAQHGRKKHTEQTEGSAFICSALSMRIFTTRSWACISPRRNSRITSGDAQTRQLS